MNYSISYEDVKALYTIFFNSPYGVSAPFIELLHKLKAEDGSMFGDALAAERAANAPVANDVPIEDAKEAA